MAHDTRRLQSIKTLSQLIAYLRDELDWPIDSADTEEVTFEYQAHELGIDEKAAVRIKEIKQLRPLAGNQPWGIFFINFEKKSLPVVVMRLILRALVIKKRASANKADRQAWQPHDLLFISSYGEETDRAITFAHFVENPGNNLAELRVLGWDDDDTPLHMEYVENMINSKLRWDSALPKNVDAWRDKWSEAFVIRHRHVIKTSEELADALAALARKIRSRIRTILRSEDGFGEIRKLQRAFRDGLIHDLNDDSFADMFAQTVTYGLFSIACRRTIPGAGTAVVKDDYEHYFTSPFLKEMLGVFLGVKSRKGKIDFDQLGVSDVTDLLTSTDTHMEVVLADFNNKTRGEDPVIHFYENFLTSYNKQLKIQRGVFYTPQPVVSYIVRSVHELLQTEFGLEDGLASTITWGEMIKKHKGLKLPPLTDEQSEKRTISPDEPFVQILDPATGTATFLVEVIDVIYQTLVAKWKKQGLTEAQQKIAWNDYVPRHLLTRLHAYELMMAPYAIAHMKIGLKLAEKGYHFGAEERARIYLTNALEPKVKQLPHIGFDALAHEAAAVNEIKWYKRFTVVIGNPPYSVLSANLTETARRIVDLYRYISGQKIEERSMLRLEMHLQDDYIKFLALSQHILSHTGIGVIGVITNSGYLDNLTLRGVRFALCSQFSQLAILNLHGSRQRRGRATEAFDENVFDIEQGVAITTGVESSINAKKSGVRYAELVGLREVKHKELLKHTSASIEMTSIAPLQPNFFLIPRNEANRSEYDAYTVITDAMPANISGIVTAHDHLVVDFDDVRLKENAQILRSGQISDEKARELLGVNDNAGWKLAKVRQEFRKAESDAEHLKPYSYRPFDVRTIYYQRDLVWCDRRKVMSHTIAGSNIALATCRQLASEPWEHLFVTRHLQDDCLVSNRTRERSYHFPLYLYEDSLCFDSGNNNAQSKRPNLSPAFLKSLSNSLKQQQVGSFGIPAGLTPEDIFHYSYAVFHSPNYRSRYAEFLKIDFPRLPLTGNLEMFLALARLGGELTSLHLLESPTLNKPISECIGNRNTEVEKISWSKNTVWVDKAQTTGFKGVREDVWNFHVGCYQICEKWLKDRKGRKLLKDDIIHYQKIIVALSETIRLMAEIDEVIEKHGGWPGAFTVEPPKAVFGVKK